MDWDQLWEKGGDLLGNVADSALADRENKRQIALINAQNAGKPAPAAPTAETVPAFPEPGIPRKYLIIGGIGLVVLLAGMYVLAGKPAVK